MPKVNPPVVLVPSHSADTEYTQQLSNIWGLPIQTTPPSSTTPGFYLAIDAHACTLINAQNPKERLTVDFNSPAYQTRYGEPGARREPFLRAMGKTFPNCFILDATAGLGKDAWSLAQHGARVLMVEQHPVLALMLSQACAHLQTHVALTLHFGDALTYCKTIGQTEPPDIIYIDPMYPPKPKSALPQKDMQWLQQLVPPNQDDPALLEAAKDLARERVVIKRPQWAAAYAECAPDITYKHKHTRWDVYLCKQDG